MTTGKAFFEEHKYRQCAAVNIKEHPLINPGNDVRKHEDLESMLILPTGINYEQYISDASSDVSQRKNINYCADSSHKIMIWYVKEKVASPNISFLIHYLRCTEDCIVIIAQCTIASGFGQETLRGHQLSRNCKQLVL